MKFLLVYISSHQFLLYDLFPSDVLRMQLYVSHSLPPVVLLDLQPVVLHFSQMPLLMAWFFHLLHLRSQLVLHLPSLLHKNLLFPNLFLLLCSLSSLLNQCCFTDQHQYLPPRQQLHIKFNMHIFIHQSPPVEYGF